LPSWNLLAAAAHRSAEEINADIALVIARLDELKARAAEGMQVNLETAEAEKDLKHLQAELVRTGIIAAAAAAQASGALSSLAASATKAMETAVKGLALPRVTYGGRTRAGQAGEGLPKVLYGGRTREEIAATNATTTAVERTTSAVQATTGAIEAMDSSQLNYYREWNQWAEENRRWQANMLARTAEQAETARRMSTFQSTLGIAGSQGSWAGKRLTFGPMSQTISTGGGSAWPGTALDPLGPWAPMPNQPTLDASTGPAGGAANINMAIVVKPVLEGTRLSSQSSAEIKQAAAAGTNAALRQYYGR
jgi:hypothetical protein